MDLVVGAAPEDPQAWDTLVDGSPLPSPFLRSWWLEAWAERDAVRVVEVTDGGALVGGLAVQVRRRHGLDRVELVGHPLAPDHCDVLALPGHEAAVTAVVAAWLGRGQSRIRLDGLRAGALLAGGAVPNTVTSVLDEAPFEPLTGDFADYLAARSRNFRKNVSRFRRRFDDDELEHVTAGPADIDDHLLELRRLHGAARGADSSFLPYFDVFTAAARRGVRRGEVLLHAAVDRSGRMLAIEAVFEVAGRLSTYQSGRDVSVERSLDLSTVLLIRAIEGAVGRGCRELDMLRGAQSYKTSWAGRTRPVLTLHASSGAAGSAVERGVRSLRTTKRALTRAAGAVVSRSGPAAQG